jgi:hypothetical protein
MKVELLYLWLPHLKKKIPVIYFTFLALTTIGMMVWDYNERPFNPDREFTGNPKNSIILFPALVCLEFILALITIRIFPKKISLVSKIGLLLAWLAETVFAVINTIHGGGVASAHAFWLMITSVSLVAGLIIILIKQFRAAG